VYFLPCLWAQWVIYLVTLYFVQLQFAQLSLAQISLVSLSFVQSSLVQLSFTTLSLGQWSLSHSHLPKCCCHQMLTCHKPQCYCLYCQLPNCRVPISCHLPIFCLLLYFWSFAHFLSFAHFPSFAPLLLAYLSLLQTWHAKRSLARSYTACANIRHIK